MLQLHTGFPPETDFLHLIFFVNIGAFKNKEYHLPNLIRGVLYHTYRTFLGYVFHVTSFLSVYKISRFDFEEFFTRWKDCHLAFPHSVIPLQMKLKSAGQAELRALRSRWLVASREILTTIPRVFLGMKSYTVI